MTRSSFTSLRLAPALVFLLTALALAVPAQAQETDGVLRGFVAEEASGQRLEGANVVLLQDSVVVKATATNGDGFYQVSSIPPGTYALRVSYIGYSTYRDTLSISSGLQRADVVLTTRSKELEGITVEAKRKIREAEAGRERIGAADIEQIPTPGPGGDLSAYLRGLPGVTTIGDRGGRLYVRGGTPSQNLILLDGTPVYKPFHILGFYSAFPSNLVSNADFYAGGFTAEYMGRASSVLDVDLRTGNMNKYTGQVAVSPFITSGSVEGPLPGLNDASFLAHYRRSFIEETAPLMIGQESPQFFYDFIGKVTGRGSDAQCSATLLRTYDRGRIDPERSSSFRWNNTSLGGRCLAFSSSSAQVVDVSVGGSHFGNTVRTADGAERGASTWIIRTNLRIANPVSWGTAEWGLWAQVNQYSFDLNEPLLGISADDEFLVTAGGFAGTEVAWGAQDQVTLKPSVGLMVSPLSIEPRARLSWQPGGSETSKLTAAGGIYRQLAEGITDERDAGSVFLAWLPTPIEDRLLQSTHALLGFDQQILPGLTVDVEGYYKWFTDIPLPQWSAVSQFNTDLTLGSGDAYGGDLRLTFRRQRFRVTARYGLNWVYYRADADDLEAWNQSGSFEYSPPHDRRHQFTLTTSAELGDFTTNLRWQYGSGRPFTQAYGYDTMPVLQGLQDDPRSDPGVPRLLYEEPYNARLPAYHRLDASVKRSFDLSPQLQLDAEAGAMNVYNRANVFYIDVNTQDRVDQLPIIPYLSLTVKVN